MKAEDTSAMLPATTKTAGQLRDEIRAIVKQYYEIALVPPAFVPGQSSVPVAGKVFASTEIELLVEASLDAWLTTRRLHGRALCFTRQLRSLRQSCGSFLPYFSIARRSQAFCRRRGHHRSCWISYYRQSDYSERACPSLCRRTYSNLQRQHNST